MKCKTIKLLGATQKVICDDILKRFHKQNPQLENYRQNFYYIAPEYLCNHVHEIILWIKLTKVCQIGRSCNFKKQKGNSILKVARSAVTPQKHKIQNRKKWQKIIEKQAQQTCEHLRQFQQHYQSQRCSLK